MMVALPIIATDVESVLAMQAHLLRDDNNDQVLRAIRHNILHKSWRVPVKELATTPR